MGGALFVVDGGDVSFAGSGLAAGSEVIPGVGGSGSQGLGRGIFLHGSGTLAFNLGDGTLYTLSDGIADVQGSGGGGGSGSWGISVGSGTLVLGAANTYTGPTTLSGGTLELDGSVISTITTAANATLSGIGTAANVLNNGMLAPGNASTVLGALSSNYTLNVANLSEGSGATLYIDADGSGHSTLVSATGTAGLDGMLYLQFSGSPAPGTTYTFMNANTFNGSFAGYETNMPSVFGEIVFLPKSMQFTVIANDLIFRNGFEGSGLADAGSCRFDSLSAQQFAAIPGVVFNDIPLCIPPISDDIYGYTVTACQAPQMCTPTQAGCPTTLHAQTATLSGSLAGGNYATYTIDTPGTADSIATTVDFSGLQSCDATASDISYHIVAPYLAEADSLGGAYIYQQNGVQANSLNATISSTGCGTYAYLISYFQPYIISQIQSSLSDEINALIPHPNGPGVGDTICPAP